MSDNEHTDDLPTITLGPDFVVIRHPVTGGVAEVHKEAAREVFTDWEIVRTNDGPPAEAHPKPTTVPDKVRPTRE